MGATLRQCAILAGDAPAWGWVRELLRFGVSEFLLLTSSPDAGIAPELPKPASISRFSSDGGAASALLRVQDRLHERFLVCDLQSAASFNIGRLLAEAASGAAPGWVAHCGGAAAGVGVFSREALPYLRPGQGWADVLSALQAGGALRVTEVCALPAFAGPRPALFLDRDGTINVDHGWVGTRERFEWVDGAVEAMRAASDLGWHVFVVTNQSGIARGFYDEAALALLHAWMVDSVHAAGGTIDDIRFCPFHPEAVVEQYRRDSDWRKPAPGMILDLVARWQLDLARCVLVGDQPSDLAAARAAGIRGEHFPGGNLAASVRPLLAALQDELVAVQPVACQAGQEGLP